MGFWAILMMLAYISLLVSLVLLITSNTSNNRLYKTLLTYSVLAGVAVVVLWFIYRVLTVLF